MTHTTEHFSIEPQMIVNHFRKMIIEENDFLTVVKAMTDDIQGLDKETAIAILSGEKTISDEMELVDEDPTRIEVVSFFRDLPFMYRNYIKHEGKIYKPHALVSDLGYVDQYLDETHKELSQPFIDADFVDDNLLLSVKDDIEIGILNKKSQIKDDCARALHYSREKDSIAIPFEYNDETVYFLCEKDPKTIPPFVELKSTKEVVDFIFEKPDYFDITGYTACYTWLNEIKEKEDEAFEGNYVLDNGDIIDYDDFIRQHKFKKIADKATIEILEKNEGHGFIDLIDENDEDKVLATVPKLPFLHWALKGTDMESKLPKYTPVMEMGWKLQLDDPIHTDWMVAAGLDLEADYHFESPVYNASYAMRCELQHTYLDFDTTVLSSGDGNPISGHIIICNPDNLDDIQAGHVLVIPDANSDYELHVKKATKNGRCAVISAVGNRACHMAVVSREMGVIMMNDPMALEKYTLGMKILIEPENGKITVV